ncbi:MAG: hypothetical protein K2X03_25925 [Bryobacteraceae bacterium]|nr:hypothetical protein [Bryobacteraceae bacterium]
MESAGSFSYQPDALIAVDGSGQSAEAGREFSRPLLVHTPATIFGPPVRVPIRFTSTSDLIISPSQVRLDDLGRAEVNVVAGRSVGTHTVTASAGNVSTTFRLTVTPPVAPGIRFVVNGASLAPGLSPCAIAQLTGANLAGARITVGDLPAPIRSATPETIVFQIPCELTPGPVTLSLSTGTDPVTQRIMLAAVAPGIFGITKANDTPVSAGNPAEPGEEIRVMVTGLGQTTPPIVTNVPGSGQRLNAKVVVGLNNEGVAAEAVYAPSLIGTYFVTFRVPATATAGRRPFAVAVRDPEGTLIFAQPATIDIR